MSEEVQEAQYAKGFNHGYTQQKYEPDLTQSISKTIVGNTEYTMGFLSGSREYQREQLSELQKLRE